MGGARGGYVGQRRGFVGAPAARTGVAAFAVSMERGLNTFPGHYPSSLSITGITDGVIREAGVMEATDLIIHKDTPSKLATRCWCFAITAVKQSRTMRLSTRRCGCSPGSTPAAPSQIWMCPPPPRSTKPEASTLVARPLKPDPWFTLC